jgi:6-phosphogluconolactonase
MPYALYVGLQDDDKIAILSIDASSGQLTRGADVPAPGGPSVMAISLDRRALYVGQRTQPALSSYRIDRATGGLTLLGTVSQPHAPTFLALDRTGRFILSAYYQGGGAAVGSGANGVPESDMLAC